MTTTLLWQKQGTCIDASIQAYLAGDDVVLDQSLFLDDIEASIAHVAGLERIDALTCDDATTLIDALQALGDRFRSGEFVLDDRHEDGHSAIEAELTEQLGSLGGRVHLGRSRNDQVLVAQRLFVRRALAQLADDACAAASAALARAADERDTPMPGYTHLQRAVPSTVGLWMAGIAEGFIDAADLLTLTTDWLDASPLGTAAGYGVNLPLDRTGVADDLHFDRLQLNPLAAQNSRGVHDVQALSAAWQTVQVVRRLAWDLSLYTTAEFGFVKLGAAHTTGSSIMPNKRNPDLIELLRAAPAVVGAAMNELQQLVSLPSGYHRDLQATKAPLLRGLDHAVKTTALVPDLIASLTFDRDAMARAIDPAMSATDRAVALASEGLPFRDAYRKVADELDEGVPLNDAATSIARRVSPGACADLQLDLLLRRLEAAKRGLDPARGMGRSDGATALATTMPSS